MCAEKLPWLMGTMVCLQAYLVQAGRRGMGLGMCDDGRLGMYCGPGVGSGSDSWMELTVIVGLDVWVHST